jgi:hypothetical protein
MLKRMKRLALAFLLGVAVGMKAKTRTGVGGMKLDPAALQREMMRRWLAKRYGAERASRILEACDADYRELASEGRKEKGVMAFHLYAARRGLALYRAVREEVGGEADPVEVVHELMWEVFMRAPSRVMGSFLSRARDPFSGFVRGMRWANTFIFPEPHWRRLDLEEEGCAGMDYTGCFYYDYLGERGAPELTAAFCEMDVRQAEFFPPQIEFRRNETLPTGYKRCDFRYYRM